MCHEYLACETKKETGYKAKIPLDCDTKLGVTDGCSYDGGI